MRVAFRRRGGLRRRSRVVPYCLRLLDLDNDRQQWTIKRTHNVNAGHIGRIALESLLGLVLLVDVEAFALSQLVSSVTHCDPKRTEVFGPCGSESTRAIIRLHFELHST